MGKTEKFEMFVARNQQGQFLTWCEESHLHWWVDSFQEALENPRFKGRVFFNSEKQVDDLVQDVFMYTGRANQLPLYVFRVPLSFPHPGNEQAVGIYKPPQYEKPKEKNE